MSERMITLELSHADAEILLGVLAAERYNKEAEAVCDALRKQLDEKLAAPGTGCPLQTDLFTLTAWRRRVVPLWYRPIRPMRPDRPEAWTHRTIWTLTDASTP